MDDEVPTPFRPARRRRPPFISTEYDSRPVRFICTDEGQHKIQVIDTLRLTRNSVEHVRRPRTTAPFNRSSSSELRRRYRDFRLSELPDFDLLCFKCRRNLRFNAERMRDVVAKLLEAFPGDPTVVLDVSGQVGRIIA